MARAVYGLASKPYPIGRGETAVGSTSVVCEYEDIFLDELSRLPPQKVVNFTIELHPGTSPISLTPHRMKPAELQELKV